MLDLNIATANFDSVSLKDFRKEVTEQINQRRNSIKEELIKVKKEILVQTDLKAEAAKQGDRSENAEYQAAIDALAALNIAKVRLESRLEAYDSYDVSETNQTCIDIGSTVKLRFKGRILMMVLTTSAISDYTIGTISSTSPVGQELMGLRPSEDNMRIVANVRGTACEYEILEVLL